MQNLCVVAVLHLVMTLLLLVQNETFTYFHVIKYIYINKQLQLMTQNKFYDSAEMSIFSSLLHKCLPRS